MRSEIYLRIVPRESDRQAFASVEQMKMFNEVGCRSSKPASGDSAGAELIETDRVDNQRLAFPVADRVPVRRRLIR